MSEKSEKSGGEGRDLWLIPRLTTMRLLNGWSMQQLAQEAKVDRDTIKKMERKRGVSDYIAAKVFAAVTANLLPEYKDQSQEVTKALRSSRPGLKAI